MAEKLGYASVAKMLREVTSEELSEWMAYFIEKDKREELENAASRAKANAKKNNR